MVITITTPALLFPALSLPLLAYTNRFLSLADRVRGLKARYENAPTAHLMPQIRNLRRRLMLLRNMQAVGTGSMFGCVLTMFMLYAGLQQAGQVLFGASLLALLFSLSLTLWEIQISVEAPTIELDNLQQPPPLGA